MFVEGIGMIHVMTRAEFVRDLTEIEREYYSGRGMIMTGSHSGKISYGFNLPTM
jgi:hypothetical protein